MKCFVCSENIGNERCRVTMVPGTGNFYAHIACSDALRHTYALVLDEQRAEIAELKRRIASLKAENELLREDILHDA